MHALETLFQNVSAVPNGLNTTRMHVLETLCFIIFSAVPNPSKYRQNAWFRDIVFKIFSEVPNRFK